MSERWKPIREFDAYMVSDAGRVRRITGGRSAGKQSLKPAPFGAGYLAVRLYVGGRTYKRYVASLVAEAFIGPRPEGHEINHINGDKTDNRPENLEYVTHSANVAHAWSHGLRPRVQQTAFKCGHPFDETNIGRDGARPRCKQCQRDAKRRQYQENVIAARPPGWARRSFHAEKTHCPRGHEYNEANTRYKSSGQRDCRACDAQRARERRAQKRGD